MSGQLTESDRERQLRAAELKAAELLRNDLRKLTSPLETLKKYRQKKEKMPPKKVKCPCGYCHESTSGAAAVQCAICDFWHHKSCVQGMSDEFYRHLFTAKEAGLRVTWLCEKCDKTAKKLESLIVVLGTRVDSLEQRMEKNEEMAKANTENVVTLKEKIENMEKNERDAGATACTTVFKEIKERENRKDNVVVHNMPEPGRRVKEGKEREAADLEELQKVLDSIQAEVDLKTVVRWSRRLGERKDNGPRPLLLGFAESSAKEKILDKAHKLDDDEEYKAIHIVQDLTKKQRDEEDAMRKEAASKNEAEGAESNYHWKVVGRRGKRRVAKARKPENGNLAPPTTGRRASRGSRSSQ